MKNAQIVLNSSPMFKTGAHERIFYGLGLGATVLTNETPWNQEHFSKEELLTYPSGDPKLVYDKIADLLNHPNQLKEMAFKGQKKVLERHTWDIRAKQLLKLIEIPDDF
jgi:spore maturation protein CgeB